MGGIYSQADQLQGLFATTKHRPPDTVKHQPCKSTPHSRTYAGLLCGTLVPTESAP